MALEILYDEFDPDMAANTSDHHAANVLHNWLKYYDHLKPVIHQNQFEMHGNLHGRYIKSQEKHHPDNSSNMLFPTKSLPALLWSVRTFGNQFHLVATSFLDFQAKSIFLFLLFLQLLYTSTRFSNL